MAKVRVIRFICKGNGGLKERGTLRVLSHGHLHIRFGEDMDEFVIQYMTMQNGQWDFSFTAIRVDSPIESYVHSFNTHRVDILANPKSQVHVMSTAVAGALEQDCIDAVMRVMAKDISRGRMTDASEKAMAKRLGKWLLNEDME